MTSDNARANEVARLALKEVKIRAFANGVLNYASTTPEKKKEMLDWAKGVANIKEEPKSKLIVPSHIL